MKKLAIIITCLIASGAFFIVKNNKQSQDDSVIIVGTNPNFPPFEFKENGELKGFEIDLVNQIAQHIGKKIMYKDLAFDTLLLEIQFGRIHMIASGMTPTPERSKKVLFTTQYLTKDPLVVITLSTECTLTSLQGLKGKEVVVNDGFTAEAYMAKQDGILLKRLATPAEAFLALTTGRAYAYVSSRSAVQPFFDMHGVQKFSIFEIPNAFDNYALAVSLSYPELHASIQKALSDMEADGSLQNLKQKWHLVW